MTRELRPQDNARYGQGAEDLSCLTRAASGDEDGIAVLYERYGRAVYSLACRVLKDGADAEDVVQDVFAQVWRQARLFDPLRGSVHGWLLMMTRTRAIDRLRANRGRPWARDVATDPSLTLADYNPTPEAAAVASEDVARVRHALAALEPAQRAALNLAFYSGLTHAEIAEALGQPLGTVKTRIRGAMSRLRSALTAGG